VINPERQKVVEKGDTVILVVCEKEFRTERINDNALDKYAE